MLRYVVRRLINYVVLLFIAVSFAYLLASYALDPRNAFNQTNPKLNWTAINQSLTNPDDGVGGPAAARCHSHQPGDRNAVLPVHR